MGVRWSSSIPVPTTSSFWPGLSSISSLLLVVNYHGLAVRTGGIQVCYNTFNCAFFCLFFLFNRSCFFLHPYRELCRV